MDEFVAAEAEQPSSSALPAAAASGSGGGLPASASGAPLSDAAGRRMVLARSYELGPGCVVGTTDFYLARPHGTRAVCRSSVARVLRFSRPVLERLGAEAPQVGGREEMAQGKVLLYMPVVVVDSDSDWAFPGHTAHPNLSSAPAYQPCTRLPPSLARQALNVLQMAVMRANTLDLSQAAQQAPALT